MIAIVSFYIAIHPQRRYGFATMCIGGGQGLAAIFERAG
jgi:acetyl-CoA acetyltransferase